MWAYSSSSITDRSEVLNKHSFNLVGRGLFNQTLLCKWIPIHVNWCGSKIDASLFLAQQVGGTMIWWETPFIEKWKCTLIILDGVACFKFHVIGIKCWNRWTVKMAKRQKSPKVKRTPWSLRFDRESGACYLIYAFIWSTSVFLRLCLL